MNKVIIELKYNKDIDSNNLTENKAVKIFIDKLARDSPHDFSRKFEKLNVPRNNGHFPKPYY